jgi:hypothetical protein
VEAPEPQPPPLRSIHTSNFTATLQELDISLVVSTYQAGKLVMVRPEGDCLNTHFRGFNKPMGLAVSGDRLAIGTALESALRPVADVTMSGVRATPLARIFSTTSRFTLRFPKGDFHEEPVPPLVSRHVRLGPPPRCAGFATACASGSGASGRPSCSRDL